MRRRRRGPAAAPIPTRTSRGPAPRFRRRNAPPLAPAAEASRGALPSPLTVTPSPPLAGRGRGHARTRPDDAETAGASGAEDDVPSPVPPPRKKRRARSNSQWRGAGRAGAEREAPTSCRTSPDVLWAPGAESPSRRPEAAGAVPPGRRRRAGAPARAPLVAQFLRPHQREGVRFLYDCVAGLREYHPGFQGYGAVLADDMGLGKTLQTVALVYALLRHGAVPPATEPFRRVVVACPCSLVANWKAEFDKWINVRAATLRERVTVKAVDADPSKAIAAFGAGSRPFQVLVISYESLAAQRRSLGPRRATSSSATRPSASRAGRRRPPGPSAPSGPNDASSSRARPSRTTSRSSTRSPTSRTRGSWARPRPSGAARPSRDGWPGARIPTTVALREREAAVLAEVATRFLLRRENRLNAAHLPRKLVQVVVCRATAAQRAAYGAVLADKRLRHALRGKQADVLASIGKLQKICNHPCARPRCICVRV